MRNSRSVVWRSLIDRNPAMVARKSVREWRFEGDLMAIGVPVGGGEQVVWRRVG
jgi:hypothetical protein